MTRVALITGASSGIGEATSRRLATEPDTEVILVARREQRLRDLAASLPARVTVLALDLTDSDAPDRIAAHVEEHHGRLTLLVNNAGASWRATFHDGGYANVRRTIELNFDSVVRLTEALLPMLRASAPSAIVNVASTAARVARPGAGAYSASKFALAGWSDSLHAEERPYGVHVALVLPGFIATEGFPPTSCGRGGSRAGWSLMPIPQRRRSSTPGFAVTRSVTCRARTASPPRRVSWRPGCCAACRPAPQAAS